MKSKIIGIMAVLGAILAAGILIPNMIQNAQAQTAAAGAGASNTTAGAAASSSSTGPSAAGGGNTACLTLSSISISLPGGCAVSGP